MILTGNEILKQRRCKNITIEPFEQEQINPNSYNYRLGDTLGIAIKVDPNDIQHEFAYMDIPERGFVLEPQKVYLGHTFEILGSDCYAMSLIGRSSLGRLGLFLQVSANLGHTGSCHRWTLELVSVKPLRVYPKMRIGQISFWTNSGSITPYVDGYSQFNNPQSTLFSSDLVTE
jgi:dCTP deaminase